MTDGAVARVDRLFLAGWILVLLVGGLLLLATTFVLLVPIDEGFFEDTTGIVYAEFEAANPEVADNLERGNRLIGVTGLGLALLVVIITWSRLRLADRWAARVLWILPLVLSAYALLFVTSGVAMLALFYAALAIVAAIGLGLVARSPTLASTSS